MKPCTGCRWLQAEYIRGPVCRLAHIELPRNPYTEQRVVRIGYTDKARADGGICGPDASRYEPKFLRRLWNSVLGHLNSEEE